MFMVKVIGSCTNYSRHWACSPLQATLCLYLLKRKKRLCIYVMRGTDLEPEFQSDAVWIQSHAWPSLLESERLASDNEGSPPMARAGLGWPLGIMKASFQVCQIVICGRSTPLKTRDRWSFCKDTFLMLFTIIIWRQKNKPNAVKQTWSLPWIKKYIQKTYTHVSFNNYIQIALLYTCVCTNIYA